MSENELLAAALDYAASGLCVFPCHSTDEAGICSCGKGDCDSAGKHPRTAHGHLDATADTERIREWWTRWPEANIGMSCGASERVVGDVDEKDGRRGGITWHALVGELGSDIEATAIVATPSDGDFHVWYRANGNRVGSKADLLGPGIDVKAEGGYVLVPPSRIAGAAYRWIDGHGLDRLADLPEQLAERIAFLKAGSRNNGRRTAAPVAGAQIPEGQRNSTLASLAGTMRRRGLTQKAIAAALLETNAELCKPPLPEREVRAIAASVAKYAPPTHARPTEAPPVGEAADEAAEGKRAAPVPLRYRNALAGMTPRDTKWLIEPYIPAGMLSLLAGAGGAAKTLFGCYLTSIVTGRPNGRPRAFFDSDVLIEPGHVMIFTLEADLQHELLPRLIAADANLDLITVNPSVIDENGKARELNPFADINEVTELALAKKTKLLITDPTGDWIGLSTDTSSDSSVRGALNRIDRIADATGAACHLIHHLSKSPFAGPSERILGSVAYRNCPRAVFLMDFHIADRDIPDEKDRRRVVVPDKTNLVLKPPAIVLGLDTVDVPGMSDRVPRVLPVAQERIDSSQLTQSTRSYGDKSAEILGWLNELLADGEERSSLDIEMEAKKRGFNWRTVKAVRKQNERSIGCRKTAYEGGWSWRLRQPQ